MIRGVLLDFYGTTVAEDDPVIADICATVAAAAPGPVTAREVGAAWSGKFHADLDAATGPEFRTQRAIAAGALAGVLRDLGVDARAEELCAPQFAYWQRPPLFPDAREFLAALDIRVCVVSNIDRADLDAAIRYHRLPLGTTVTSEDVRAYKPDPALFRAGLAALDLAPHEVVHVGDSLRADVRGARAAGIVPVWVNRAGRPVPPDASDVAVARDLREVLGLLETQ